MELNKLSTLEYDRFAFRLLVFDLCFIDDNYEDMPEERRIAEIKRVCQNLEMLLESRDKD